MAGNTGGPWGGGGSGGDDGRGANGAGNGGKPGGGRRPGEGGGQMPEIDELVRKGQEQLRVLMGGRGGNNGTGGSGPGGGGGGPRLTRGTVGLVVLGLIVAWGLASFYTVKPEEQSVELFLGEYSSTGSPGLNFAPWPLITSVVLPVTREQTENIGSGASTETGLMLTTDENIIDIDFQVVWNISDPAKFLFNLAEPDLTIRAVSESAMREVVARSELAPILNRDRQLIADQAQQLIQVTLDQYDSGVNILRLNLDKADPPREVIDSFREVQAAEQQRDRLQREADTYANRELAGARGEAAQTLEEAEAYRAQQVNEAQGEAARFTSVLEEYAKAPQVTRKRLYLEAMEKILGDVDKIILEETSGGNGGQGVVPYLPLNQLRGGGSN
ncbi:MULTISPECIES: FtsH protease activity modulator HflK [Roseobacteraceae]|uniref:Protein HflK n=1 Tax=Pseudosulfitobacter pseudonitzschiae TaxID=1402135 RepID=A0A221JYE3_9RHOB|nr:MULTISPECIES: FtsH protease activity modulator HflK [Roseobacteraceae]ASM71660.1 modulator of FtsH protease HflK [Pseudosulfitobacter pseudonitzschiae]